MQPMRASLTSVAGGQEVTVEGEVDSPEGAGGTTGQFEIQDTPEFMQEVMDGKEFSLAIDGGSRLTIKITSISTTEKSGISLAKFSST
jgi:hypothetical protein